MRTAHCWRKKWPWGRGLAIFLMSKMYRPTLKTSYSQYTIIVNCRKSSSLGIPRVFASQLDRPTNFARPIHMSRDLNLRWRRKLLCFRLLEGLPASESYVTKTMINTDFLINVKSLTRTLADARIFNNGNYYMIYSVYFNSSCHTATSCNYSRIWLLPVYKHGLVKIFSKHLQSGCV